jgi:toluene monooxygenase electron transfer component
MSPRDVRRGRKLACQCEPAGDITIKAQPQEIKVQVATPQSRVVVYQGRTELTADMAEFRFTSDVEANFLPGQFAMFTLPGIEGERALSMSNLSNKEGDWHFIVKKMSAGKGSTWLFDNLNPGDELTLDGPFGHAYINQESERDIICIAGGSGLSPVLSILRSLSSTPAFTNRKVHLFFGGRGPADICTPELVAQLPQRTIDLTCHEAISDASLIESSGWEGECCFVHELVAKRLGESIANFEIYFCGPPPMTEAVQRMLMLDFKVPFEQIHFDRFF